MGRVFYRGLEMQNIFIKLAVSISAGFDARLLSGAVLSILLVFVLGRVFHGRNERAVPYTVSIPPQLDDNYEWKSEEIDQPRQDVSEVCKKHGISSSNKYANLRC